MVENENKIENFISDNENSQLEIVSTDWRPIAEVIFAKERGKDRKDNLEVNLEEFISIKGINALGNQLTKDKINQINLLEPLPYEPPKEVPADDIEVIDEEVVAIDVLQEEDKSSNNGKPPEGLDLDDEGQITLF